MSEWVKQSTARTILVGPVLDTDGLPYTTDDLVYTDFKITKAGTTGNLNASATVSHSHQGHFEVVLTTSDLDTLGGVLVSLNNADLAMSPWSGFVATTAVYNALVLGSANLTSELSIAAQQDVAQIVYKTNTWFVNKLGNDGNGGLSPDDAKLTGGAAVSAAAGGDRLVFGPGTFDEQIDLHSASKTLAITGAGKGVTILTSASSGNTLRLHDYCTLRRLSVTATHATGGVGLAATSKTGVVIEDCAIDGPFDGLMLDSATRPYIHRCEITSTYDGVNCVSGTDIEIDDCFIQTDGSYAGASEWRAVIGNAATTGIIRNSRLVAESNTTTGTDVVGIRSGRQWLLVNTAIRVRQTHAGGSGDAIAVKVQDSTDIFAVFGCQCTTSCAGSGAAYDLFQSAGSLAVSRTEYNPDKTSGTITDLDERACDNRLLAHNLDHWCGTASGIPTIPAGTYGDQMMDDGSETFNRSTDSLQAIRDYLAGLGTGTGARTVTITVDDGSDPLESAAVRFTKGATTRVGTTSVSGQVVFGLDDGTWAVAITLSLYTFTPTTLVVDGDETETYSMTALSIPGSDPGLVTGYLYCYDEDGTVEEGAEVDLKFYDLPGTGVSHDTLIRTETSDSGGLVTFTNLFAGAEYLVRRGQDRAWERIAIDEDATGTVALTNVKGLED